jgi:hypothetical protein
MSAEAKKVEETIKQDEAPNTPNSSEVVELEWPEVEQIYDLRTELTNIEAHFSAMCLNFEKRKTELLRTMSEYENAMYSLANQLKAAKNINPELTYELKLPNSTEEKAYFLRKDT